MKNSANKNAGTLNIGFIKTQALDTFAPTDARDLYDRFTCYNTTLKALGSLLSSSNMEEFSGEGRYAQELREGLGQILTLYVERQENELGDLHRKAMNSPEWMMFEAKVVIDEVSGWRYKDRSHALKRVMVGLSKVDAIIAQFGEDEYPKAVMMRNQLLKLQDGYASLMNEGI